MTLKEENRERMQCRLGPSDRIRPIGEVAPKEMIGYTRRSVVASLSKLGSGPVVPGLPLDASSYERKERNEPRTEAVRAGYWGSVQVEKVCHPCQ